MDEGSKYYRHDLLYLMDLDCPNAEDIIALASSAKLFGAPYRWLVIITARTNNTNINLLHASPILADSDLVLAMRTGNLVKLTELYTPSVNGTMISTPRGYYNGSVVDVRPHRELYRRRRDMRGHSITMSNVIQDSNTTLVHLPREDRLEPQYDSISKLCWMSVKLGLVMLNATPVYIFSNRWGYKVNGQWSGMIDDVYSGRAELGTNLVITEERLDVVSYTDSLAPFKVRFIFRQPPLPYVTNIFTMPFSTNVWVAMFVCAVVGTITVYLAAKWEAKARTGLFAFHSIVEPVYRQIEDTFLENEKCDLMEVDFLNNFDPFVPVRKGSPYFELFRVAFKQVRESGLQSALSKRLQVSKPHCTTKMSSFSSVGLMDMRPVLILMLYGICLAVAILLGEIFVYRL
ncbi:hypothetical protein HF086_014351 [Spodoptera exigua]|uniref:Ionotropic receptor 75a N-terminal domain-containing protein n=1 Tax=Spodoptera exigua TaxID=7107 RepID=A0A922SC51_SPOEX|nr:hypothetical protein HF086_014351 [Spodoptera exigua]